MKISEEELNVWEQTAVRVNGRLLKALSALSRGDVQEAQACISEARERNWTTRTALIRAGAQDSIQAKAEQLRELEVMRLGVAPRAEPDVSLQHLTSPTNRRYLTLLQELHAVALERDRERGCLGDGTAEGIAAMIDDVELEIYGPAGSGRE